jgi:formylglycine-generating enzyme required for sulfatase activity
MNGLWKSTATLAAGALAAAAILLLSPTSDAQQEPTAGRKLAFLVGVKEYDHPELRKLAFTENDVDELAQVLRDQGFDVTVMTTVRGQRDAELKPTAAKIREQLQKILKTGTKQDLIVVGLSGHGIQPLDSKDSYFCPQDAVPVLNKGKLTDPDTLISIQETLNTLRRSKVGLKLLLVDACRDDPTVKGAKGVDDVNLEALPQQTGILLSCSPGEFSFEHKSLGSGHGAFFYHVIKGLKGEARDPDGTVTWESLRGYVRKRVPAKVKELYGKDGGEQNPNEFGNLRGSPAVLAIARIPGLDGHKPGQIREDNGLNLELVWCPPGVFKMGDDAVDVPVRVTLTKGFWLGKYELTQSQWKAVMQTTPWSGKEFVKEGDDYPATYVSWNDATKFCEKLTETEGTAGRLPAGWKYTLPTEAQWEYACRAGTTTRYGFGDDRSDLGKYAWCTENTERAGEKYAHEVGRKLPNQWGLYDMHGNVEEWCRDWCADHHPGGRDPEIDLGNSSVIKGPGGITYRVRRGGAWEGALDYESGGFRNGSVPVHRDAHRGFRVALNPSGK